MEWFKTTKRRLKSPNNQRSSSLPRKARPYDHTPPHNHNRPHSRIDSHRRDEAQREFLPISIGDEFCRGRYVIRQRLGHGQYSTVWLAQDKERNGPVAIKVLSNRFYNGGIKLFELQIMRRIRDRANCSTHPGRLRVMDFLDDFEHEGPDGKHVCLVFGVLGPSLEQQMTKAQVGRLPYPTTKRVVKQLLEALDFMHTECGVLHTDIQTSNVLIENRAEAAALEQDRGPAAVLQGSVQVRLSDFGLACWEHEHLTDRIQPPVLRAPEITLDAPWEASVDVYDLGCLIYALVTGSLPFPGRPAKCGSWSAEDDRLRVLTEIFGSVPEIVLENASRADHFYDQNRKLRRTPQSSDPTPLEDMVDDQRTRRASLGGDMPSHDIPIFCDFLRDALATDPRKRKTAGQLLDHPWLASSNGPNAKSLAPD